MLAINGQQQLFFCFKGVSGSFRANARLLWGAVGIGFLSEGYRSVWLCVFGVFVPFFVAFGMPIARGAGIFFR